MVWDVAPSVLGFVVVPKISLNTVEQQGSGFLRLEAMYKPPAFHDKEQ